jgi:NADH:ubiquinone oxidoreductase subunit E
MIIQVCVGSSCHLKGSEEIVGLLENALKENQIEDDVVLVGSFCLGKCSRSGITIQIEDDIHVGITRENFREFFNKNILEVIRSEGA